MTKEWVAMTIIYLLAIAAGSTWPYQSSAHAILIVVTVLCTSIPAVMIFDMEGMVGATLLRIKAEKNLHIKNWFKAARNISWTYIPLIMLLILAGYWVLAVMWIFNYAIMMKIGGRVLEKLKKEGGVALKH